jgi:hypothetical protein
MLMGIKIKDLEVVKERTHPVAQFGLPSLILPTLVLELTL